MNSMNAFQWITLPILALVLAIEVIRFFRTISGRAFRLVRMLFWAGAFIAIARPALTSEVAHLLGIGLGVNLLVYLLAFAFVLVSFFLYARIVRLQRDLTEVVRALAIEHARRGGQ